MADQAAAEAVKVKGNAAFAAGKHEEAARLFTRCIELDGSNHIYYSNRAAAFTGLQDYGAAARDARRCTELKPHWAKGWSRLGAAYFGLEQFAEVKEPCPLLCVGPQHVSDCIYLWQRPCLAAEQLTSVVA